MTEATIYEKDKPMTMGDFVEGTEELFKSIAPILSEIRENIEKRNTVYNNNLKDIVDHLNDLTTEFDHFRAFVFSFIIQDKCWSREGFNQAYEEFCKEFDKQQEENKQ